MTTALARIAPIDVVRQVLGADVTLEQADVLLWEYTSFPFGPDLEKYRTDLQTYKAAAAQGKIPCSGCGAPITMGDYLCATCEKQYEQALSERGKG